MSCIGTAGHVDHGKSTLVTALTGMDPDRLAEEKARGMTIDLGFAWLTLPSGREASIVDVPGHEAFIKNMLAGVGGIDAALLVVAADEGVMPQTDEHLAILDLLRVRSGVVALTKCDLVDDDWLELVREDVAERLKGTTLEGIPITPCSAVTRAGLPELLAALDTALDTAPARRDIARPRLPIDRVFTITGFGTIVTGTLQDGTLRTGQEVEILPSGLRARIRGLQSHKHAVEMGFPGARLAVNLAGIAKADLARGDVLSLPAVHRTSTSLDVRLDVVPGAPRPIAHNAEVDVYAGAAEVPARVILLEADELAPGASGWAQLRLQRPLAVARGDRFILRIPSPSLTVAGGVVVDAPARRHRRRDGAVLERLRTLALGDPEELVLAALRPEAPKGGKKPSGYGARDLSELADLIGLPSGDIAPALAALERRELVVCMGSLLYATSEWRRLRDTSSELLSAYHRQYPLRSGMPREEWRARVGLSAREADGAFATLAEADEIAEAAPGVSGRLIGAAPRTAASVRLPAHRPLPTPDERRRIEAVLAEFHAAPFAPPTRAEVEQELGADVTAYLLDQGELVRVSDVIVLDRAAYAEAVRRIVTHLRAHPAITVAEARDLLDTTRKYMLAIFEHLDERRITRRQGDDRILGPAALALAAVAAPGEDARSV